MATTASGFWYPDEATSYNINTLLATMASSMETKVGPYVSDTGYVNITLSGISGTATYRRIGKLVEVVLVLSGSIPEGTNVFGTIPAGIRPNASRRGVAYMSGNTVGSVAIAGDGRIVAQHSSGATRSSLQSTVVYTVD